jgi:hypothetical protein
MRERDALAAQLGQVERELAKLEDESGPESEEANP